LRRAILLLGLVGVALFTAAFAWTFASPVGTERLMRELVRLEVQRRVDARIELVGDGRLAGLARNALGKTDREIKALRQRLHQDAARKVADVVGNMLDADCPCRQRIAAYVRGMQHERLASLILVRERLTTLVESAYASVSRELRREFRIFTASNAIAFGLLAVTAVMRRRANLQLLLPALVLVGAVFLTGGLYLFNQDWLHTIVFGDYLGLGYAAWLASVALLLADIVLNRARLSTRAVNIVLNLFGAAAHAVTC
jgi:hypothetical protein